ncbi:MAG: hypothetical protein AAF432_09055 [Planctomycetota bacterium]
MTWPDASHLLQQPGADEGAELSSAEECYLKGLCELELPVSLVTVPHSVLGDRLMQAAERAVTAEVLHVHQMQVTRTFDAGHAVALARSHADSGRGAATLLPNINLGETLPSWANTLASPLRERGGFLVVTLTDHPQDCPAIDPRQAVLALGIPTLEASGFEDWRILHASAARISRATSRPVAIVTHESIWRSADTIDVQPNRVAMPGQVGVRRRQRRRTRLETDNVLRLVRRYELNGSLAFPNPGERVTTGFVVVGPARAALSYVIRVLELTGRVPILHLTALHPIDDVLVGRLLSRCDDVIVLEPRPGTVETLLHHVATRMRQDGEAPANIWGNVVTSAESQEPKSVARDEMLHPSVLARRIAHLLHEIRPSVQVQQRLHVDEHELSVPTWSRRRQDMASLRALIDDAVRWINDPSLREERDLDETSIAFDDRVMPDASGRIVHVSIIDDDAFLRTGVSRVRYLATQRQPALMLVQVRESEELQNMTRFVRGAIPGEHAARTTIVSVTLDDELAAADAIRQAIAGSGLTICIVTRTEDLEDDARSAMREIDALGFEARQRLTVPADFSCHPELTPIAQVARDRRDGPDQMTSGLTVEELGEHIGPRIRVRMRSVAELVDVFREQPPASLLQRQSARLPVPTPHHGHLPVWRAHFAGVRGDGLGVAAHVLAQAGHAMGYVVRGWRAPQTAARTAGDWSQVLFTQPRSERQGALPCIPIPFGEAQVLIGQDRHAVANAIRTDGTIRVAASDTTCAMLDWPTHSANDDDAAALDALQAQLETVIGDDQLVRTNVRAVCRTWFHSDRMLDVVLLGAAYQRGWIPVTNDAIEVALVRTEKLGFGQIASAFHLGRRLIALPDSVTRTTDGRNEPVMRLVRRLRLGLHMESWGGDQSAGEFGRLVDRGLTAMPGLAETDAGRTAQRQFVLAVYGCLMWGGFRYAEQYADRLVRLYHADRGDRGRQLTRDAVRPLAEAMLIPDPLFIMATVSSPAYRGRLRRELHVRRSRGDRLVRSIVTRLEVIFIKHRLRAHLRIGADIARVLCRVRRFYPARFRGTRRDREQRELLTEFVDRAVVLASKEYETLCAVMSRCHEAAQEGRFRRLPIAELRQSMRRFGRDDAPSEPMDQSDVDVERDDDSARRS